MDKLEQARITINEIDQEIAKLFEKRMQAVEQVALYKKEYISKLVEEIQILREEIKSGYNIVDNVDELLEKLKE